MSGKIEVLTPYVNTDIKIPKSILDALTLHEFSCLAKNIATVTPDSVKKFLVDRFGDKIAIKFRPEYLIKAPSA